MFEAGSFWIWLLPFVSFLAVVVAVLPSVKLARMAGVIDRPGGRKQHEKAVPPIGGLVVFPVFMLVALLGGVVNLVQYWPLYVGLIVLLVAGALDDRFGLNPWLKFWTQVGVAVLIVVSGEMRVMHLGFVGFGEDVLWTGWVAYPFTIAAVVLLINAVNLMDGLDGLAAGKAVVMLLWFIVTATAGYTDLALLMGILAGALCGFLVYNMRNPWRRKASVFLGDAGSMCLGLALAWFAITMAKWPMMPLAPVTVAWIVGLPIFDACAQFYRRIREGRHPFSPDRGHFHHHFIDAGVPVHVTSPVIMLIVAFMGAFGYFGVRFGIPEAVMMVLWAGALFAHMAMSYRKERYVRLIARLYGTRVDPVTSAPKKI